MTTESSRENLDFLQSQFLLVLQKTISDWENHAEQIQYEFNNLRKDYDEFEDLIGQKDPEEAYLEIEAKYKHMIEFSIFAVGKFKKYFEMETPEVSYE